MSDKKKAPKRTRRWLSWILSIFRFLLVPALCAAAIVVGLYVGYSVIGERESSDIWIIETWKHVYDLVFTE